MSAPLSTIVGAIDVDLSSVTSVVAIVVLVIPAAVSTVVTNVAVDRDRHVPATGPSIIPIPATSHIVARTPVIEIDGIRAVIVSSRCAIECHIEGWRSRWKDQGFATANGINRATPKGTKGQ